MSMMMENQGNRTGSGAGNYQQIQAKRPHGYRQGATQQYTPEQMQLYEQLFSHVGPESYLSRLAGGDQSMFNEMEAPAHRQFNEQIGNIASRFSAGGGGRGALGSRRSSGFQNTTSSAASNFAQDLASRRQQMQRQATMDLAQISQMLLGQRPYEQYLIKKEHEKGGWGGVIGAGIGAIPGIVTANPMLAIAGASAGHGIGSQF